MAPSVGHSCCSTRCAASTHLWVPFALSAITALLGATLAEAGLGRVATALDLIALGAGFVAVAGLVLGCTLLLRETRIAVRLVSEEAALLRDRFARREGAR